MAYIFSETIWEGQGLSDPTRLSETTIKAARNGDPEAQQELAELIRAYAHHVCHGGKAVGIADLDWEDVAQEASRQFFSIGVARFRSGGPVRSYLYSIVRSTYLQMSRSAWRRRLREQRGTAHGHLPPNPEFHTYLHRVLAQLSEACQELLERLYFDGATYAELAVELNLTESSVRARATRCLQSARALAT